MFKQYFFFYKSNLVYFFPFVLYLSFSGVAFAQISAEGSFRLRSLSTQIHKKEEITFLMQDRFLFKSEFHPSNQIKTEIHIISSHTYGKNLSLQDSLRLYPSGSWYFTKNLELSLGRIFYENNFSQMISLNDYESFLYSFDGAFLEYDTNILNVKFWSAYLPKKWIGTKEVQEYKYGLGFFLDIKSASGYIDQLNVQVAYLVDSFFEEEANKISLYGLGLEGSSSNLDYVFVVVGQGQGVQFKFEESMYHFELTYSNIAFFNSRFFVGYHTDSPQYDPWLYNRHENSGYLDLFSWGNLTYYFIGLSVSAPNLFEVKLSFYDLHSTGTGPINRGYFGSLLKLEDEELLSSKGSPIGRELDIQISKPISKEFELNFLAGLFIPRLATQMFPKKNFYNRVQLTGFYKF